MKNVELREYTDAEVEALGKAGKAFKNDDGTYSYPIDNVSDLKSAIKAVGRGSADHDAIRKFIIKRAKALGESDLIPDNWNSDGSLSDATMAWSSAEERETFNDLWTALDDIVQEEFSQSDAWGYSWCWLQDITDGEVIFQSGGALYSAAYELEEGGPITLGDPVRVRPITSYVPTKVETEMLAQRAAAGECATCGGTGKIKGGSTKCPDCGGSGTDEDAESTSAKSKLLVRERTVADEVAEFIRNRRDPALAKRTVEWRRAHVPKRGDVERRSFTLADLEVREADDDDSDTIVLVGYASVTGRAYSVGHYEETIAPNAFKRTLANPDLDVLLLVNHTGLPYARTTSGTLRLSEDERGLRVEADLDPSDPDVQALVPKMKRGDVTEMSFAFRVTSQNDQEWSDDYSKRLIKSVDIQRGDVSIVSYGASPTTTAALRAEQNLFELRALGFEAFLEALVEWSDFRMLPIEARAGKALSSASMEVLTRVLSLVANADEAVDEAQPLLADLMGVPNPDAPEGDDDDGDEEKGAAADAENRSPGAPDPASAPESAREARIRDYRAETLELRMWFDAQRDDERRAA